MKQRDLERHLREHDCRFYRDAKILTIGEGSGEIQQLVIARQLG